MTITGKGKRREKTIISNREGDRGTIISKRD